MDHTKHYLVAEMVHGALLPLQRYNGIPVVEWKHLMQTEKDEKAQAVLQLASTGIVEKHPETQEETIFCGLVMTMYPIEVTRRFDQEKLTEAGEKKVDEELAKLAHIKTIYGESVKGSEDFVPKLNELVQEAEKGTPIK